MQPRPYQEKAIDSIFNYFGHSEGDPLVAMPTGTGKGTVIGFFIEKILKSYPDQRVMNLTHVKELIQQNSDELNSIWSDAPSGICSAGLNKKDVDQPITFAGIGSVIRKVNDIPVQDLLLIDEAHLVSPNANTQYRRFIDGMRNRNPYLKVIGFTATDYRLGQGRLTQGKNALFTDVCYDLTKMEAFNELIADGYMARLVPKPTDTQIDLSGVHIRGGEFINKELSLAVDQAAITKAALQETLEVARDRKHWLIFATSIEHAEHIAEMLNLMGIRTAAVHSKMPDRNKVIQGFKTGYYQAIVNVDILTTGFNFKPIDLIVMLRPTMSPGLWVQILGRGTRPFYMDGFDLATAEGRLAAILASQKPNCMVLDFAGNTARLGPINDPVIPREKGKKKGKAPIKICEACNTYIHASLMICPECGHEFPKHVKIKETASNEKLIAEPESPVVELFPIDRVTYSKHSKKGGSTSLKVSYYCGMQLFQEWICLEHETNVKHRARKWWREHGGDVPEPTTIDDAILRMKELKAPARARVWINKKYPEILGFEYAEPRTETPVDKGYGEDNRKLGQL